MWFFRLQLVFGDVFYSIDSFSGFVDNYLETVLVNASSMESFHRRPSTSWNRILPWSGSLNVQIMPDGNRFRLCWAQNCQTEVGEQQVVSSAPMLKQSAFTHSFIDQSITYILSFPSSNPSSLVVLYKPNLSTYIRQVITSCERKPRSAQSIYSNCRTKNRETVIIKMVTTYWKHSNIMRDRVESVKMPARVWSWRVCYMCISRTDKQ